MIRPRDVLPELADLPALAAFLLGGRGRPLSAAALERLGRGDRARGEERAVAFLVGRRLAGEAAASSVLHESGLSRGARMSLAVERERLAATARTRAATLARVGEALGASGLSALLYKGEAVVALTHGDPGRRPMTDIDLIVAPAERAAAFRCLEAAGFVPKGPETDLHDVFVDATRRGPGHPHGVAVEVHDDVFPRPHPFGIDLEAVRRRSTPSTTPSLRIPAAADELVLSAFHLVLFEKDAAKSFLTLRDVALLSHADGARQAADVARDWGIAPVVRVAGLRAEAWAGGASWLRELGGDLDRARWRRRAWLAFVARELDRTLAQEDCPPRRVLPVHLSSAAWQASPLASLRAAATGLVSGRLSAAVVWGRFRRYAGAMVRSPSSRPPA